LSLIGLAILCIFSCRYIDNAADTAYKEFKPETLLKKYEQYKDISAALDKKIADIGIYQGRIDDLKSVYVGVPRQKWLSSDVDQMNLWMSEVAGVKASYNSLAAEYNSAMSKFNYRFCNVGDLPRGATIPLPKEFKPYIDR
jgi:hypothetical protein